MDNPRIVVVTGLPATGKTTLARKIAARFRLPLVAKDVIKEPLLDVLGAADAAQSRRLSDASFAVMFGLARELWASGSSLVLEGNFRPGEHEGPLRTALSLIFDCAQGKSVCQILCTMDEQQRLARLAVRHADPSRHAGHRDADLAQSPPNPLGATFLALPGARFVYDGANDHTVLTDFEHWWNGVDGDRQVCSV